MSNETRKLNLCFSLADQSFDRTKSLGILNFSIQLVEALARQPGSAGLKLLGNRALTNGLKLPITVQVQNHEVAVKNYLGRLWWDQIGVYTAAQKSGAGWLLLPKGFASFTRRSPVRLAVFVHDLMQAHYDRNYPNHGSRLEAAYFRAALHASLRQAEVIFTPTECVRREVEEYQRNRLWPAKRVVCCGEGFEAGTGKADGKCGILVLASRFPHKLTHRAMEYLSEWQHRTHFAEPVHWVGTLPDNLIWPEFTNWKRHPRLSEVTFKSLLGSVRALVFFSDYEGFGRPPVEAAIAGAHPVYSNLPVTREVMGGRGFAFEHGKSASFATALDRALATPNERAVWWGEELSLKHKWEIVAKRVMECLNEFQF